MRSQLHHTDDGHGANALFPVIGVAAVTSDIETNGTAIDVDLIAAASVQPP